MEIPAGGIVLWYGAIVDIPVGFVLCDGTLGTPDLRDKFIVGAGSTYAPGNTGGAVQHNHPFTGDGHSHALAFGAGVNAGTNRSSDTSVVAVTGTTNNTNHLPPYHALCYIMKT